jgi:colanic acid biosynthesis glycosyl transferase WcaI
MTSAGERMRIIFICCVFPPEPEPTGVMAHQLASRLGRDGHGVTVIAPFPNRPGGRLYNGFSRRLRTTGGDGGGYKLVRCANWFVGERRRSVNRLLENLTFGLSATWAAWRELRPDVILIETWPLLSVQLPALLSRLLRIPWLYYVKDVYPEAAEKTGLIRADGVMARLCRFWDRCLCLSSGKVIVISESMRDLMVRSRDLSNERFTVIPDWIDPADFLPQPIDNAWRREQQIPRETFVAMFGGTLGQVSGVEVLVEVARLLRDRPNLLILCIGEGVRKQQMIDLGRSLGLENIRFLPFQPRERLAEVQGAANATILTMRPEYSDASVPSKLISYFAAGRPVICAASRDTSVARIVSEAGSGIVTEPGDPGALARAIVELAADSTCAEGMGSAARKYFEQHFTLDRAYGQFSALLKETVPVIRP